MNIIVPYLFMMLLLGSGVYRIISKAKYTQRIFYLSQALLFLLVVCFSLDKINRIIVSLVLIGINILITMIIISFIKSVDKQ